MSTPKWKRITSPIEYLEQAFNLTRIVRKIIIRLPKRGRFLGQTKMTDLSHEIEDHLHMANTIKIIDEYSFRFRLDELLNAKGKLESLVAKMVGYREDQDEYNQQMENGNKKLLPGDKITVSEYLWEEFGEIANKEISLIIGMIKKTIKVGKEKLGITIQYFDKESEE